MARKGPKTVVGGVRLLLPPHDVIVLHIAWLPAMACGGGGLETGGGGLGFVGGGLGLGGGGEGGGGEGEGGGGEGDGGGGNGGDGKGLGGNGLGGEGLQAGRGEEFEMLPNMYEGL